MTAKVQHRRSISVRGTTYARFRAHCDARGVAMSELVERLIAGEMARDAAPTSHATCRLDAPELFAAPPGSTMFATAAPVEVHVGRHWRRRKEWGGRHRVVEVVRLSPPYIRLRTVGTIAVYTVHQDHLREAFDLLPEEPPCPPPTPAPASTCPRATASRARPVAAATAPSATVSAPAPAAPTARPQPLRRAPRSAQLDRAREAAALVRPARSVPPAEHLALARPSTTPPHFVDRPRPAASVVGERPAPSVIGADGAVIRSTDF